VRINVVYRIARMSNKLFGDGVIAAGDLQEGDKRVAQAME
jgi:hypothetical protein